MITWTWRCARTGSRYAKEFRASAHIADKRAKWLGLVEVSGMHMTCKQCFDQRRILNAVSAMRCSSEYRNRYGWYCWRGEAPTLVRMFGLAPRLRMASTAPLRWLKQATCSAVQRYCATHAVWITFITDKPILSESAMGTRELQIVVYPGQVAIDVNLGVTK